ncbi:MAG: hypothetical protein R3F65_15905 [bacterium]
MKEAPAAVPAVVGGEDAGVETGVVEEAIGIAPVGDQRRAQTVVEAGSEAVGEGGEGPGFAAEFGEVERERGEQAAGAGGAVAEAAAGGAVAAGEQQLDRVAEERAAGGGERAVGAVGGEAGEEREQQRVAGERAVAVGERGLGFDAGEGGVAGFGAEPAGEQRAAAGGVEGLDAGGGEAGDGFVADGARGDGEGEVGVSGGEGGDALAGADDPVGRDLVEAVEDEPQPVGAGAGVFGGEGAQGVGEAGGAGAVVVAQLGFEEVEGVAVNLGPVGEADVERERLGAGRGLLPDEVAREGRLAGAWLAEDGPAAVAAVGGALRMSASRVSSRRSGAWRARSRASST